MLVKQAANVLDLLEFFARERRAATLAELSSHFGWPRSSTYNLISTLVERGFLYEPKRRGGFYPTPRWLALAEEIATAEPLPEAIVRLIRDLARVTGETVWVAGPSGQHAVLLTVIESAEAVRYTAEPGRRVPIHATASGQALLSQMAPQHAAAILRKAVYKQYAGGAPMSAEEVKHSIRTSLASGWFRSAASYSRELGGVSVPLVVNERVLSLTVAGPLSRVEDQMQHIAIEVHKAVARHFGIDYFAQKVPNLHRLPV